MSKNKLYFFDDASGNNQDRKKELVEMLISLANLLVNQKALSGSCDVNAYIGSDHYSGSVADSKFLTAKAENKMFKSATENGFAEYTKLINTIATVADEVIILHDLIFNINGEENSKYVRSLLEKTLIQKNENITIVLYSSWGFDEVMDLYDEYKEIFGNRLHAFFAGEKLKETIINFKNCLAIEHGGN